jgi:hypothetical protein
MSTGNGNGGLTKPVTQVVSALQGSPMLLALVVMNCLILGMITYLLKTRGEIASQERTQLLTTLNECISKLTEDKRMQFRNPARTTNE